MADWKRWAQAGYLSELLPIGPPGGTPTEGSTIARVMGKSPAVRTQQGTWSGLGGQWSAETYRTKISDAKRYLADGASIGMQGRNHPGLDIDVDDAELAARISDLAGEYLGFGPVRTRECSPRRLHMFRLEPGAALLRKVRLEFRDGSGVKHAVELLATGQQYVVEGPHPKGGEYAWREADGHPCDVGPNGLPAIDAVAVDRFFDALRAFLAAHGCTVGKDGASSAALTSAKRRPLTDPSLHAPSAQCVLDLLMATPCTPERFPDRDAIVSFLCAVKASLTGTRED